MPVDPPPDVLPYGAWPSPLSADAVAAGAVRRSEPRVAGDFVLWAERRPDDAGRTTIVCVGGTGGADSAAAPRDVPGTGSADIRTFVHEYGGGAWIPVPAGLAGGGPATGGPASGGLPAVLGACAADQRLRLFGGGEAGDSTAGGSTAAGNGNAAGRPATPPAPVARGHRYADPAWVPGTDVSVWVREVHDDGAEPPRNEIVSVRLDGTVAVLAAGADFYASPQPSPDGTRLAFLSWDHPNMPWDHTRLHLVELDADVAGVLDRAGDRVLLDGPALQQPRWSPDGRLHVVSDADGYWDIVRVDIGDAATSPLVARPPWAERIEFGVASWAFAEQTYAWPAAAAGALATTAAAADTPAVPWCTWVDRGVGHIGRVVDGVLTEVDCGFTEFGRLEVTPAGNAVTVAAGWTRSAAVVEIAPDGSVRQLSATEPAPMPAAAVSIPQSVEFATTDAVTDAVAGDGSAGGATAHAFCFPPAGDNVAGPADELPPLLVLSHGGPTGCARSSLDLGVQFWTSRGFAVVDVNYRGSTGFGTAYRNALRGGWGVVDVADCIAAARHVSGGAAQDGTAHHGVAPADPARLVIKGGSAGGYTTLCALVDSDVFAAGISRYGVADLEALARDTHKFESRYLDSLVGPWPREADLYRRRSPVHRTDRLRTPMIVLQGDEDLIVPPAQSEQLVAALRAAGVAHSYLLFAGEQHGFRQTRNIVAALWAELSFLGQMLGFAPADAIEPVRVHRRGQRG